MPNPREEALHRLTGLDKDNLGRLAQEHETRFSSFYKANSPHRQRMTLPQKLDALGISREQAERALDTLGPRFSTINMMKYDEIGPMRSDPKSWRRWRSTTGKDIHLRSLHPLLDHFLGQRALIATQRYFVPYEDISVPSTQQTLWAGIAYSRQFIIDLDSDFADPDPDLYDRYSAIAFHARYPPIVFTSSDSGGFHLLWGLPVYLSLDDLYSYAAWPLERLGIPVLDGVAEIFPYWGKHLRVPLGPGSHLLDPVTLAPLGLDLSGSLNYIRNHLEEHSARNDGPFCPWDWTPDRDAELREQFSEGWDFSYKINPPEIVQAQKEVTQHKNEAKKSPRQNPEWEINRRLYEEGLSGDISRWDAVPRVIRHLFFGLGIDDKAEMKQMVRIWLRDKLNGFSSRYLKNPPRVERDAERAVDGFFDWVAESGARPRGSNRWERRLSEADLEWIYSLARKIQSEFGGHNPLRRTFLGLVSLFQYFLRKGEYDQEHPTVPLPKKTIVDAFDGWTTKKGDSFYYPRWLKVLSRHGILTVVDSQVRPGKCRTYGLAAYMFREDKTCKSPVDPMLFFEEQVPQEGHKDETDA